MRRVQGCRTVGNGSEVAKQCWLTGSGVGRVGIRQGYIFKRRSVVDDGFGILGPKEIVVSVLFVDPKAGEKTHARIERREEHRHGAQFEREFSPRLVDRRNDRKQISPSRY